MARDLQNSSLSTSSGNALLPSAAPTIARIRELLQKARHQALAAVNSAMVRAYWEIGREIVEEEQRGEARAGYGQSLVESLAAKLTEDFGKGFTPRNLWFMCDFYRAFPNVNALRSELSWTHYRLLSRVDRADAKAFYEQECVAGRWSTRELERQINSLLYFSNHSKNSKKHINVAVELKPPEFLICSVISRICSPPLLLRLSHSFESRDVNF